jgi:hypothetical protein
MVQYTDTVTTFIRIEAEYMIWCHACKFNLICMKSSYVIQIDSATDTIVTTSVHRVK